MNAVTKIEAPRQSLIVTMAGQYAMDPGAFAKTVRSTCMPGQVNDEEFAAFLLAAHQYDLNPVTREIFAFPKKGGGIQPIVSVDGWFKLANANPAFDGVEYEDKFDPNGKLTAITCRIYRKDRNRPTAVTEYMSECVRPTEPWQKWPARMLRHKAFIQCARTAFGFAGIIDQDEAERSPEVLTGEVVAPPPPPAIAPPPRATEPKPFDAEGFLANLYVALGEAEDEEAIELKWDEWDVESTLSNDQDAMQRAFDMKKDRMEALTFPGDRTRISPAKGRLRQSKKRQPNSTTTPAGC